MKNHKNSFIIKLNFTICFLFVFFGIAFSQVSLEVNDIEFIHKDSASFDESALKDVVGIAQVDVYDAATVGNDIYKLKKFYFDNGFFDTQVDTLIKYNLEDNEVDVQFIIKENKRYRIDRLIYNGLDKISKEIRFSVDSIQVIKERRYYNKVLITQQGNSIVDLLQNNGYMNAKLKEDSGTLIRKYNETVTVTYNFENADTIFYFGKTRVHINDNEYGVSENLLYEEITYEEGEIYSKQKRLESERGMSHIAIVGSARLVADSTSITNKPDFTAEINLTNKVELVPYIKAANIDNIFFFGGGAQLVNKYLWGAGRVLNLQAESMINSFEINRTEFTASITQPHVIRKNITLIDKITLGLYNLPQFKSYYTGNLTSASILFGRHTFYNTGLIELNEELVWFKYEDIDSTLKLFNSVLSVTAIHDNTNDAFSPSAGFYHSISAGSGGLIPKLIIEGSDLNISYSQYVKFFTDNRFYFNLSKRPGNTVIATNFKVGDIIEYGTGDKLIPVQPLYKFFSGGSSSLRGWNAQKNGMVDTTENGGNFLLEGSVELRKKLFPRSRSFTKNIGMALFFDYGNIWKNHSAFKFDEIALAIGFGVRYDFLIGPIRIDFGFKLYDPKDAEDKWLFSNFERVFKDKLAIHFGIGQSF